MALGSLRECEAILALEQIEDPALIGLADKLGAILYTLSRKSSKIYTGSSTELRADSETATDSDS